MSRQSRVFFRHVRQLYRWGHLKAEHRRRRIIDRMERQLEGTDGYIVKGMDFGASKPFSFTTTYRVDRTGKLELLNMKYHEPPPEPSGKWHNLADVVLQIPSDKIKIEPLKE